VHNFPSSLKALAEKAAWDFMKAESRHFDMVCINLCHTWGFYNQYVDSPSAMNSTNSDLLKLMDGEEKGRSTDHHALDDRHFRGGPSHINALCKPEASGPYIIANHPYDF
jgi:hypothetical protein